MKQEFSQRVFYFMIILMESTIVISRIEGIKFFKRSTGSFSDRGFKSSLMQMANKKAANDGCFFIGRGDWI